MKTLEELRAHYKAVRQRLNNPVIKKITPKMIEPEPVIVQIMPTIENMEIPHAKLYETPAQKIVQEVCEKHGITIKDMKGDSRVKYLINARQEVCHRLKIELKFSLAQIGKVIGDRDHTTVLHAIKRYRKRLAISDEPLASESVSGDCGEKA